MIGVTIITHRGLAEALLEATRFIVGDAPMMNAVTIEPHESVDQIRNRIRVSIKEVGKDGDGVLVLTDMFGGTPSNISLSFLEEEKIEVITGVNLPMLIKLASGRENGKKLSQLALFIKDYGQKNISVASEILLSSKP